MLFVLQTCVLVVVHKYEGQKPEYLQLYVCTIVIKVSKKTFHALLGTKVA